MSGQADLPPLYQALGELVGEMKGMRTDIQEIKGGISQRNEWEKKVEARLSNHEARIKSNEKRISIIEKTKAAFRLKDATPAVKITITGSMLTAIGLLVAGLIKAGVHP